MPDLTRYQTAAATAFLRLYGPLLAEQTIIYSKSRNRYGVLLGLPSLSAAEQERPAALVYLFATEREKRMEAVFDEVEMLADFVPVLYGFEDLATEMVLPGGGVGVPAAEVAKLLSGRADSSYGKPGTTVEYCQRSPGYSWYSVTGASGHAMPLQEVGYRDGFSHLKIIRWLLAAGFAVGLRPDQYQRRLPGFDYASGARPLTPLTLGEPLPKVTPCPSGRNDCPSGCPKCPGEEVADAA